MKTSLPKLLAAAALASLSTAALAAPTIYFGENQAPGDAVSGDPLAVRNTFLSQLTGVGTESFSSFADGDTAPLALNFPGSGGGLTATLEGSGSVASTGGTGCCGRFNTSGAAGAPNAGNWWTVSGDFEITFSTAISAFGFYGTDIGDFSGQVTVALTAEGGAVSNYVVANTVNGQDGSLLFWGFIDKDVAYTKITFGNTNAGTDFFGFDDMTIGDRGQVVPEPATLALVGLSLLGLGAARRRRG